MRTVDEIFADYWACEAELEKAQRIYDRDEKRTAMAPLLEKLEDLKHELEHAEAMADMG